MPKKQVISRLLFHLIALCLTTVVSFAEQLPVKTYSTGEGLPRDEVTLLRQDSRGFLWMAAGDGISRFDGYKFTNYATTDGLADRRVNDLLETRSGVYWIATDGGLCRFNPTGLSHSARKNATVSQNNDKGPTIEPMFVVFNPTEKAIAFNALLEDETGDIWCATSEGLFKLAVSPDGASQFRFVELGVPSGAAPNSRSVVALLKDRHGALWCSVGEVLVRLLPDGRVEHYSKEHGLPGGSIASLLEDHDGNIWAGTRMGLAGELLMLVAVPDPSRPIVARIYGAQDGLTAGWINRLRQTHDGKLWAACSTGLYMIAPSSDSITPRIQLYNARNGLCNSVWDLTEDRDGNLWVASTCGTQKVARNGFTGYGPADGLGLTWINSIFENHDGALFVASTAGLGYTQRSINLFDGTRFHSVVPNLPSSVRYQGWGWGQIMIQDHLGEWWIPGFALYHFPKGERIEELARAHPQVIRTVGAFNRAEVFRLYEDARGDIWTATTGLHFSLQRWERATGIVHDHTAETGVPPNTDFTAFREDRSGNLWVGTSEGGGLLRYRDGKFQRFTTDEGAPPGWIIWLYLDHAGRLWIASQLGGLNCIDDPGADALRLKTYTTADGLSSNNIRSITEDEWGRIYAGMGRGVDRVDVETGSVKHFTVADGLPKGSIEHAYRDRQGALWFGSSSGLSRFVPEKREARTLPSVYLTGLRVDGVARPVSELGSTELPTLSLASYQRQVSVDFVGLGASLGEELRYQYYLEGASNKWSAPTEERTINFANLASGAYRFQVRALDADGRASSRPAVFAFTIAAPIWQRGWFVTLMAVVAGLLIYSIYNYRLGRLVELERVRTRIATDLHDDIGSSLSQVSVLSEVIRRRVGHDESVAEPLSSIATLSRDLVDSMSDIVWAINPHRDRLSDLTQRMRRFASDLLSANNIEIRFDLPDPQHNIRLGPDMRREIFLIFKEGLNNIVRHSGCATVEITFHVTAGALDLTLRDNGRGFDPETANEGNGLDSMRRRAGKLGGSLYVSSSAENGTEICLKAPMERQQWLSSRLWRNGS